MKKNSIIGYLKREELYPSLPESKDSFSERRREDIKRSGSTTRRALFSKL